jgi:hypothetical protein
MDENRVRELIRRWDDPYKPTRSEAAELLARAGERVVPFMREVLMADEPDPDHVHYALWVLETIASPEAEELVEAYWDRHG